MIQAIKSRLSSIFPTLYEALKIGVPLTVANATPEKSLSKLLILKNKLCYTIKKKTRINNNHIL